MQVLDTTILNTAKKAIARAMDVMPLSVKSVLANEYAEPRPSFTSVEPLDGRPLRHAARLRLGDLSVDPGLQRCAASTTEIETPVACRTPQGAGGAMMVPVGRMTLARTYDKADLVRILRFAAMPGMVGPMVGRVLAG